MSVLPELLAANDRYADRFDKGDLPSPPGRRVAILADGAHEAGQYGVAWNGKSADGRDVPSGVYFSRFESESRTETRKMVLIR